MGLPHLIVLVTSISLSGAVSLHDAPLQSTIGLSVGMVVNVLVPFCQFNGGVQISLSKLIVQPTVVVEPTAMDIGVEALVVTPVVPHTAKPVYFGIISYARKTTTNAKNIVNTHP